MGELIEGIRHMSGWAMLADLHGFFAMLALILLGASIGLLLFLQDNPRHVRYLKATTMILFFDVMLTTWNGILVYIPYRAEAGPRTFITQSTESWLHEIVFEHKEFTAFMPWLICIGVVIGVFVLNKKLAEAPYSGYRRWFIGALIAATVMILSVAAEAVLVTKFAPVG